ncbi:MAG: hypothetical protein LBL23_01675 [Coriobacteriales bacterium]|jgi:hypothetical protein|nr:hypothetical protein [Coriobacteriales bacterium]
MAQANEFNYLLAKTAWMSSGKYLLLIKKLVDNYDALERGNLDTMMNEGRYSEYAETQEAPPEGKTDARSLIPFIYTLYNSVEQLILAYYYAAFPNDRLTFVPTFEKLLMQFDENDLAKDEAITRYVHKYSYGEGLPELLRGLLDASGYDVDHLKKTRRALENNSLFNVLDKYQPYYFSAEQGRQFFTEVNDDANEVLARINLLIADVDDDGNIGDIVAALRVH